MQDFARDQFNDPTLLLTSSTVPKLRVESDALGLEHEAQKRLDARLGFPHISSADRVGALPYALEYESLDDTVQLDNGVNSSKLLYEILVPGAYSIREDGLYDVNEGIKRLAVMAFNATDPAKKGKEVRYIQLGKKDKKKMTQALATALANMLDMATQYPFVPIPSEVPGVAPEIKEMTLTQGDTFIDEMFEPLGNDAFNSDYARMRLAIQAARLVINTEWFFSESVQRVVARDPVMYDVAAWFLTMDEDLASMLAQELGNFECHDGILAPHLSIETVSRRLWRLIFKFNVQKMTSRVWPFKQPRTQSDLGVGKQNIRRHKSVYLEASDMNIARYVVEHNMRAVEPYVLDYLRAFDEWTEAMSLKFAVPTGSRIRVSLEGNPSRFVSAKWFAIQGRPDDNALLPAVSHQYALPSYSGIPTPLGHATPIPSDPHDPFTAHVYARENPALVFALVTLPRTNRADPNAYVALSADVLLAPVGTCVRCREGGRRLLGLETKRSPYECSWALTSYGETPRPEPEIYLDDGYFSARFHTAKLLPHIHTLNLNLSDLGMLLLARRLWDEDFTLNEAQAASPQDAEELVRGFDALEVSDASHTHVTKPERIALTRAVSWILNEFYDHQLKHEPVVLYTLTSYKGIMHERRLETAHREQQALHQPEIVSFTGTHSAESDQPDYLTRGPQTASLVTSVADSAEHMRMLQDLYFDKADVMAALHFNSMLANYYPEIRTVGFERACDELELVASHS